MFEFLVFVECSARLLPPEYLGQEAEKKWLTKKRIRIPRSLRSPVHNLRLRLQHHQSRQHLRLPSHLLLPAERLRRLRHQSRQHHHRPSRLLLPGDGETPASPPPKPATPPPPKPPAAAGETPASPPPKPATPPPPKPPAAAGGTPPPAKPKGPVPEPWSHPIVDALKEKFATQFVKAYSFLGQNQIEVKKTLIAEIMTFMRDNPILPCQLPCG